VKVTLEFDADDVRSAMGDDPGFVLSYSRHRVEAGPELVGLTYQTASIAPVGSILSLALVDKRYAEPGTAVSVVWGDHPGPGTARTPTSASRASAPPSTWRPTSRTRGRSTGATPDRQAA
jgi:hypothetical protein